MTIRETKSVFESVPTTEGAGVRLKRGFAYPQATELDPFLLFDDFSSDKASDFSAGFPWHPHRGMETVTYLLSGEVAHEDSLGNAGTLMPGDVQWMSAGSGIIHQEMPQVAPGNITGFQLWVNLPKARKMDRPRYQDMRAASIPLIELPGVRARIIAGSFEGTEGVVRDVSGSPTYLDVTLEAGRTFEYPVLFENTVLVYVISGSILVGTQKHPAHTNETVLTSRGDTVHVEADGDARFLLLSGTPLNEPVAWSGPIVMNTHDELVQAFQEISAGTFIRSH